MIIKNFKKLATTHQKKLVLSVLESGLRAAMPNLVLKKIIKQNYLVLDKQKISLKNYGRIYVIAVGKAADLMTKTVNSLTKIDGGIVVIPQKTCSMVRSKKFIVLRSSHPIPDAKSVIAAKKTIDFLAKLQKTDFVIFLISGGASSLLSLPDGISIREKQTVTILLLRSGANIQEINCVRKHLSKVKGGQLVKFLRCQAVALVMSDVIGDDLSAIASGLTYYDNTTFQDAKKILIRYGLKNKVPKKVWQRIDLGARKLIPETPKKTKIKNYVISSNKNCLDEMSKTARKLGLVTKMKSPISGNVENAALKLTKLLPSKPRSCLIFGGETTVKVKGKGKGGRNQELILHLLNRLSKQKIKLLMTSVGTDGIDGNTPAAGAIVISDIAPKMIKKYLCDNDSYAYFRKYGGLIFTGPTHTNLMDIGLILRV
ncbi:MAG: glycerate kinase type-2 family protein [Nitrosotalea sp.]